MADDAQPAPIQGDVIGRSITKAIVLTIAFGMFFLFGVFLIWARLTGHGIGGNPMNAQQVTPWGLIFGILIVFTTPIMVAFALYQLLTRHRLIIGRDRLQLVRRLRGEDVVLDQIPYWNIAEIKYEHRNGIQRIVIRLTDPDDADTYTRAGRSSYQYRERHTGWHFIITGGYQASVPSIHDRIRSRAKRYRGK